MLKRKSRFAMIVAILLMLTFAVETPWQVQRP